jgi:hypothetical protein
MAIVQNIIDAAARKVGISSLSADDLTNALEDLNNLLGVLGIEFLAPYVTRESLVLTAGDAEYTIGSAGDLNTVRPIALLNIFIRDSGGYDYPIDIINAVEYNDITIKTTEARPGRVYFLPEYPLVKIIFDYEPDEAYTAYFEFQKGFAEYTDLTDTVTLPNEYKEALTYNLAIKIAEDQSVVPSKSVVDTANYTKLLISRLGAINRPPKEAEFEFNSTASYKIETGTY